MSLEDDDGSVKTGVASEALEGPTASDVYIEDIHAGGSGCNPDTVLPVIALDRKSFVLVFTDMQLQNPNHRSLQFKNCLANVRLHVPQGWQVSLATVNTRGFAALDWGIRARQSSSYFFAGNPLGTQYHSQLVGPVEKDYVFTDDIPFESHIWSQCGRSEIFAIDTRLYLNATRNPDGNAIFNTTDVDGAFKKVFHLEWRPCQ